MKYTIICSAISPADLIQIVNQNLTDGWKPSGGVSVASHYSSLPGGGTTVVYLQAMVKED